MSTPEKIALTNLDVRIGNLFDVKIFSGASKECRIKGVNRHFVEIDFPNSNFGDSTGVCFDALLPIVITPEFLLKNGFLEIHRYGTYRKFQHEKLDCGYDIDPTGLRSVGFRYSADWFPCEYVHELQNLMYTLLKHKLA